MTAEPPLEESRGPAALRKHAVIVGLGSNAMFILLVASLLLGHLSFGGMWREGVDAAFVAVFAAFIGHRVGKHLFQRR